MGEGKIKLYNEVAYILGIIVVSIGVNLMVRSDCGLTIISALSFVLSKKFTALTFGVWTYLAQGLILLIMIMIVRTIRWRYFLAFGVSVVYGYCVDLVDFLMREVSVPVIWLQPVYFFVGFSCLTMGAVLMMKSALPTMVPELFLQETLKKYKVSLRVLKTGFDLLCLALSAALSFVFFNGLVGIGLGTLLSVFVMGSYMQILGRGIDRIFILEPGKISSWWLHVIHGETVENNEEKHVVLQE